MNTAFVKSKAFKYTLGILGLFFIFLLVFPILFKDKLQLELQKVLDSQLQSEAQFSDMGVTFFRHFPSLTLTLDDLLLTGSEPFSGDTLLYTKSLGLGVSVPSLLTGSYKVNELFLDEAVVKILRDIKGNSNFDILKTTEEIAEADTTSDELEIDIKAFHLSKSRFLYYDTSTELNCLAAGIEYHGSGALLDDIFKIGSDIEIDEFQLDYGDIPIFNRNKVLASLETEINTESTELTFVRNELQINELPVNFVGKIEFIEGGYDMNFVLESFDAQLKDMLSVVPSNIMPGFAKTTIEGMGDIVGSFQGFYLPDQDEMPALVLNLQVREGYIAHIDAPAAIENLGLKLNVMMPKLDPDLIKIDLDTLGFTISDGFLNGNLHVADLNPMLINSQMEGKLDLGMLNEALGTEGLDFRGMLDLSLNMNGYYATYRDPKNLRTHHAIATSFPVFSMDAVVTDGYFKFASLPEGVSDIDLNMKLSSPDSIPKHFGMDLTKIHFNVLDQTTDGFLSYDGRNNQRVKGELKSIFDMADIPKFYPLDSGFQVHGMVNIDFLVDGEFNSEKKTIPIIEGDFSLSGGYILTPYHPEAIKDLSMDVKMSSSNTSFSALKFEVNPINFSFANNPFSLSASVENLDDIRYELRSKGRLDLGELYKVFGIENLSVDGYLITDVSLKGLQSDAMNGRLKNLENQGTIEVERIQVKSQFLPQPLSLEKGVLEFVDDKIEFQNFLFGYEKNKVRADGYFSNYLGYLTSPDELLKGNLQFRSSFIDLDDFAFFGEDNQVSVDSLGEVSGVIVPPMNLDVTVKAEIDSLKFGELMLKNFSGQIKTQPGILSLDKTKFDLIGTEVEMTGKYLASTPYSANFDYKISAENFDIHRAYEEVKLFREMASFAEYAQGIASLHYELAGRLDANMIPVLPSIVGGGTLGLNKIKLSGFKLMNSIAKETENEELTDPEVNDAEIETTIANNLITIPRTKMRIAGFRPRFEGQVSLDGDLSIGLRLGLPPLGIFGIPIKITGNAVNYEMEVGKITKADELEEVTDKEQ